MTMEATTNANTGNEIKLGKEIEEILKQNKKSIEAAAKAGSVIKLSRETVIKVLKRELAEAEEEKVKACLYCDDRYKDWLSGRASSLEFAIRLLS